MNGYLSSKTVGSLSFTQLSFVPEDLNFVFWHILQIHKPIYWIYYDMILHMKQKINVFKLNDFIRMTWNLHFSWRWRVRVKPLLFTQLSLAVAHHMVTLLIFCFWWVLWATLIVNWSDCWIISLCAYTVAD